MVANLSHAVTAISVARSMAITEARDLRTRSRRTVIRAWWISWRSFVGERTTLSHAKPVGVTRGVVDVDVEADGELVERQQHWVGIAGIQQLHTLVFDDGQVAE